MNSDARSADAEVYIDIQRSCFITKKLRYLNNYNNYKIIMLNVKVLVFVNKYTRIVSLLINNSVGIRK